VDVVDGNIVFCPRDAAPRTLTSSGIDFAPSLSPDAKSIVFVRSKTEMPVIGALWDSRIFVLDIASGKEREIAKNAGGPCQSLDNPVFGFSDLVLVDALGHNLPHFAHRSVCAIELHSHPPIAWHVAPGAECVTAIDSGTERGQLFVRGTFRSASNPTAGYARIVDRKGRTLRELDLDLDSSVRYGGKQIGLACP
jgi:hypothetical protein